MSSRDLDRGLLIQRPMVGLRTDRTFGGLMIKDAQGARPGIEVRTQGDRVVIGLFGWQVQHGVKIWTRTREISLPAKDAALIIDVMTRAVEYLNKSGGSA